jgi:CS domain
MYRTPVESGSALHGSIKSKKDMSYYYAVRSNGLCFASLAAGQAEPSRTTAARRRGKRSCMVLTSSTLQWPSQDSCVNGLHSSCEPSGSTLLTFLTCACHLLAATSTAGRSSVQHAPRDSGDAAPMPVHRPIATAAYAPENEATIPIKRFQFLDDDAWAKVYLPMDDLASITQDNISASFEPRSFTVQVRGLQKGVLEFKVEKLHGEIDPKQSTAKLLKTKIMVKMRKVPKPPKQDDEAASKLDTDSEGSGPGGDEGMPDLIDPDAQDPPADAASEEREAQADGDGSAMAAEPGAEAAVAPEQPGEQEGQSAAPAPPKPPKIQYAHWYGLRAD